jgi:hypothetical protein
MAWQASSAPNRLCGVPVRAERRVGPAVRDHLDGAVGSSALKSSITGRSSIQSFVVPAGDDQRLPGREPGKHGGVPGQWVARAGAVCVHGRARRASGRARLGPAAARSPPRRTRSPPSRRRGRRSPRGPRRETQVFAHSAVSAPHLKQRSPGLGDEASQRRLPRTAIRRGLSRSRGGSPLRSLPVQPRQEGISETAAAEATRAPQRQSVTATTAPKPMPPLRCRSADVQCQRLPAETGPLAGEPGERHHPRLPPRGRRRCRRAPLPRPRPPIGRPTHSTARRPEGRGRPSPEVAAAGAAICPARHTPAGWRRSAS